MLADWQKLDMGVAHLGDVRDELLGEFVVGEKPSALAAPPGAEMRLVDRHRLAPRFAPRRLAMYSASVQVKSPLSATTEAVDGLSSASRAERIRFQRQQLAVRP